MSITKEGITGAMCLIVRYGSFLLCVGLLVALALNDAWPIRSPPTLPNGDAFALRSSPIDDLEVTKRTSPVKPHPGVFSLDVSGTPSILVVLPARSVVRFTMPSSPIVDCLGEDGANTAHSLPPTLKVPIHNIHTIAKARGSPYWKDMSLRFVIAIPPTEVVPADPSISAPAHPHNHKSASETTCKGGSYLQISKGTVGDVDGGGKGRRPVVLPEVHRVHLKKLLHTASRTQDLLTSRRLGKGSVTVNDVAHNVDLVTYGLNRHPSGRSGSLYAKLVQVGVLSGLLSTLFTTGSGLFGSVEVVQYIVVLDESRALLELPLWIRPADVRRVMGLRRNHSHDLLDGLVGPLLPNHNIENERSVHKMPLAVQLTTVRMNAKLVSPLSTTTARGSFSLDDFSALDQGYSIQESHRRDSHIDYEGARTGRGDEQGSWNWRQSRTVYTPIPRLAGSAGRNRQVLGDVHDGASVDLIQPYSFAISAKAFCEVGGFLPEANGYTDPDGALHPPMYGAHIRDALLWPTSNALVQVWEGVATARYGWLSILWKVVTAPFIWMHSMLAGPGGPGLLIATRPTPVSELIHHPHLLDRREIELGFAFSFRLHRHYDQLYNGATPPLATPIVPIGTHLLFVRPKLDDDMAWELLKSTGNDARATSRADPILAPFAYVSSLVRDVDSMLPLILGRKKATGDASELSEACRIVVLTPNAETPSEAVRMWRFVLSPMYDVMVNIRPISFPTTTSSALPTNLPIDDEMFWQWHLGTTRTIRSERRTAEELGKYLAATAGTTSLEAAIVGSSPQPTFHGAAGQTEKCVPNTTAALAGTFTAVDGNWSLSASFEQQRTAFDLLATNSLCTGAGTPHHSLAELAALHSTSSVAWSLGFGCLGCCGFAIEVVQYAVPLADSSHYAQHSGGASCFCDGYADHETSLLSRVDLRNQGLRLHRDLSLLPAVVAAHGVPVPPHRHHRTVPTTWAPTDTSVLNATSTSWIVAGVLNALTVGSHGPRGVQYTPYTRQHEVAKALVAAAERYADPAVLKEAWTLLQRVALPVKDKTYDHLHQARHLEEHGFTFRAMLRWIGFPCYTALRPSDYVLGDTTAQYEAVSRFIRSLESSADTIIDHNNQPVQRAASQPRYVRRIVVRHTRPEDMFHVRDRVYLDRGDRRDGLAVYDYHVCRSMFEASRIHRISAVYANRWCDEVWVPGTFLKKVFVDSGVNPDRVIIMPEGTDVDTYDPRLQRPFKRSLLLRPTSTDGTYSWRHWCSKRFHESNYADEEGAANGSKKPFVFFSNFKWEPRKGWKVLIESYYESFGEESTKGTVLLNILTHLFYPSSWDNRDPTVFIKIMNDHMLLRKKEVMAGDDEALKAIYRRYVSVEDSLPPICIITQRLPEQVIPRLYATADAFVLPTRAEGWGLPIILGMAMGLPCITTNWGGVTEFATPDTTLLVDVLTPEGEDVSQDPEFDEMEPGMRVATPLTSHLRVLMRQLYDDRVAAVALGQRARAHIVANFSSSRVATLTRLRLLTIARKLQAGEGWV